MKNYYKDFVSENKALMLDIYSHILEKKMFDVEDKNFYETDVEEKIETVYLNQFNEYYVVTINDISINVIIKTKNMSCELEWYLGDLSNKEERNLLNFENFNKPNLIMLSKISSINEKIEAKLLFYPDIHIFKINVETNGIYEDSNGNKSKYINNYNFFVSDKIEVCGSSDSFLFKEKELENKYAFLRSLPHSNIISNNLNEVIEYLCEGKDLSIETKDLFLINDDMDIKIIQDSKELLPNINLFSERIKELYSNKEFKNRKNKLG